MNFVNVHGEPLSIGSRESHIARRASKAKADIEKKHMGWAVSGFSPEQLAKAKEECEKALLLGGDAWDEAAYMNGHRPQKAHSQPYSMPDSAAQCAEMLKRAGWLRVQVMEVIR